MMKVQFDIPAELKGFVILFHQSRYDKSENLNLFDGPTRHPCEIKDIGGNAMIVRLKEKKTPIDAIKEYDKCFNIREWHLIVFSPIEGITICASRSDDIHIDENEVAVGLLHRSKGSARLLYEYHLHGEIIFDNPMDGEILDDMVTGPCHIHLSTKNVEIGLVDELSIPNNRGVRYLNVIEEEGWTIYDEEDEGEYVIGWYMPLNTCAAGGDVALISSDEYLCSEEPLTF